LSSQKKKGVWGMKEKEITEDLEERA